MPLASQTRRISLALDRVVQLSCVVLLILLVLNVWLGIMARYVLPVSLTFTEELARYLMIWMALLAVSSGIAHREHIGVEFVFDRFSPRMRRVLAVSFDVIALIFFGALFWYGLGFVERGFNRSTMIFDVPKGYFFIIVPLAAALSCIQLILTGLYDASSDQAPPSSGAAALMNDTGQLDQSGIR